MTNTAITNKDLHASNDEIGKYTAGEPSPHSAYQYHLRELIMPKRATMGPEMQDDHKVASSLGPAGWDLMEGFPIPPREPEF